MGLSALFRRGALSLPALWAGVSGVAAAEDPVAPTFGMRLRPVLHEVAGIHAPVVVHPAPTNESCMVARADGTLENYSVARPSGDAILVIRSRDGGLTWSAPETAFPLPGAAYYAVRVLEAADGTLHAVFHLKGEGEGGYRGRLYEVYYTRRPRDAAAWSGPRRIVAGYVGSIRGFVRAPGSGRLLLGLARAIPERALAPKNGPDHGWNDTFVYYSDNGGDDWRESPDQLTLELKNANVTRLGAIEPVLLPLRDGRIWMLVRDRGGRLWQSFSDDGSRWAPLQPSPFISSDSPAELLRLRDGRIVLFVNACQNWSDPRSYAMGGREVLQAAISADEGRTWRGFREVLHEPAATTRGDRGSAYPSAVETKAGKVLFASGQGEGKRALVMFDPRWLEERAQRDDPPVAWTAYGSAGLRAVPTSSGAGAVELLGRKGQPGGGAWNFPIGGAGEIAFRVRAPAGVSGLRLALSDHFNRLDDAHAAEHAVFATSLDAWVPAAAGAEHAVIVRWRDTTNSGSVELLVDDRRVMNERAQRPAVFGVNYLRLEFRAEADGDGVRVSDLAFQSRER